MRSSYLDGVLALREVGGLLLCLLKHLSGLGGRQASSDCASLLCSQIQRQVLLVLVEQAELGALLEVDNSEDACDRLADVVTVARRNISILLNHPYRGRLEFRRVRKTYMRFSLAPDELIFWILS